MLRWGENKRMPNRNVRIVTVYEHIQGRELLESRQIPIPDSAYVRCVTDGPGNA